MTDYLIRATDADGTVRDRTYRATSPDEACTLAERDDAGRWGADVAYTVVSASDGASGDVP